MGLRFLRVLRILLVLLASTIFVAAVHHARLYGGLWMGVSAFLAIYTGIAYGWALKAQAAKRNIIKSNCARGTGSFLLFVVWMATRFFGFPLLMDYDYYCRGEECAILWCIVEFGGVALAILIFFEMVFAHRYERSFKALKRDAEAMGNIIVIPEPVQPTPYYPHYAPQQYVYGQVQPGQPLMYYPQPAMTASHQTFTMPNQDPNASYKIQQETSAHPPHPPSTHQ